MSSQETITSSGQIPLPIVLGAIFLLASFTLHSGHDGALFAAGFSLGLLIQFISGYLAAESALLPPQATGKPFAGSTEDDFEIDEHRNVLSDVSAAELAFSGIDSAGLVRLSIVNALRATQLDAGAAVSRILGTAQADATVSLREAEAVATRLRSKIDALGVLSRAAPPTT